MDMPTYQPGAPLGLFFLLVLGIIALPGMDMAYVMANALAGGRRYGFAAVGGIVAGGVVHVAFAVFGIGMVVRLYPMLFDVLLLAGAAYMGWIGVSLLRGASALTDSADPGHATGAGIVFGRGTLTCLLNPKAYLFTLAVFPQFLQPGTGNAGSVLRQAVLMGAIVALTQAAVYGSIAWGASGARHWLLRNPVQQIRAAQAVGLTLIVASVWAAWHGLSLAWADADSHASLGCGLLMRLIRLTQLIEQLMAALYCSA